MKHLIRMFAVVALAGPALSQVEDGQWFKAGYKNGMFQIHVSENPTQQNVLVSVTPQGGVESAQVPGVPGPDPGTCVETNEGESCSTPDYEVKVDNAGKVYYTNDNGDWIHCGAARNPPRTWPVRPYYRQPSGAGLPLVEYNWDWTTSPLTSWVMVDDWIPVPPRRTFSLLKPGQLSSGGRKPARVC